MEPLAPDKKKRRGKSPESRLMELINSDDKDAATVQKIKALQSIVARRAKNSDDKPLRKQVEEMTAEIDQLKRQLAAWKKFSPELENAVEDFLIYRAEHPHEDENLAFTIFQMLREDRMRSKATTAVTAKTEATTTMCDSIPAIEFPEPEPKPDGRSEWLRARA